MIYLLTGTFRVTVEGFRLKLYKEAASLSDRSRELQWPHLLLAVVFITLFQDRVL